MLEVVSLITLSSCGVAFVKNQIAVGDKLLDSITSGLSAKVAGTKLVSLLKFAFFPIVVFVKLVHSIGYLTVSSQYVVVLFWKLSVLANISKNSFFFCIGRKSENNLSVTVRNLCLVAATEHEWTKVFAANIHQVTIDVAQQSCCLGKVYWHLTLLLGVSDKGCCLSSLSDTCHVADNKGVSLLCLL